MELSKRIADILEGYWENYIDFLENNEKDSDINEIIFNILENKEC